MNYVSRLRALSSFVVLALATSAAAQPTIVDPSVTLFRDVDASSVGDVHGLSIDPGGRNAYFIGDTGNDIYELSPVRAGFPTGEITQIADDVGRFIGVLSDLRVGPDRLIYVGDSFLGPGETDGDIFRFRRDGTPVEPVFASVEIGAGSNAFGIAFDCNENMLVGETGPNLYSVSPAGDISIASTGWVDIDEVERGENNEMFVLDGSARMAEWGTVFLRQPDGTVRRYAEGLDRTHSATFDRGSGDLIIGTYSTGNIVRLTDANGNGVIDDDPSERITLVTGFATNRLVDVDYGRASSGPGYALYAVANDRIYEFRGFDAPRFGGCGARFDDDGDGFCDTGVDLNGDGDCDDVGEDTDDVDCDDTNDLRSPGLMEMCTSGIDNDCDGLVDLADPDCATLDTDMDGIPDVIEVPLGDFDRDGLDDFEDPDDDNDGVPTRTECPDPADCRNTDGLDGPDYRDDDDDGDGVPTRTERPGDADQNTDGDDDPDYLDPDDDGDGVPTRTERPGDLDQNTDGDDDPNHLDPDDDGDGIPTATELADVVELGAEPDDDDDPAYLDTDSDGDGVLDMAEGRGDLDGDDIPNYLDPDSSPRDTDMDGIRDDIECPAMVEPCPDTDMNGTPDFADPDDDGDGVPTIDERRGGEDQNTDMDAFPDHLDTDDDGDGLLTADECEGGPECVDSDDDDLPDYLDEDDDNDTILTATEIADEAALGGNVDGDDLSAHLDTDSDGDGISDSDEGTDDDDGDGAPNYLDADSVPADEDMDGVPDRVECPDMPCRDTDMDGTPDFQDPDDDEDGVPTRDERPGSMNVDTDDDGTPDYLDPDDDGDGISTRDERPEGVDVDTDMDGTPNHRDDDDDDDGIATLTENTAPEGTDVDGDDIPNYLDTDSDDDGALDIDEGTGDDDGDGIPNYLDPAGSLTEGGISGGACSATPNTRGGLSWLGLVVAAVMLRRRKR